MFGLRLNDGISFHHVIVRVSICSKSHILFVWLPR